MSSVLILPERQRAWISRNRAFCIEAYLPARLVPQSGILVEHGAHWERISSDGHVVRCHTYIEALNARDLLQDYIDTGQFLALRIEPYDPVSSDLPYYQWVRGIRGKILGKFGMREEDLPESQDPSLARLSDEEWINLGPR